MQDTGYNLAPYKFLYLQLSLTPGIAVGSRRTVAEIEKGEGKGKKRGMREGSDKDAKKGEEDKGRDIKGRREGNLTSENLYEKP